MKNELFNCGPQCGRLEAHESAHELAGSRSRNGEVAPVQQHASG